MSNKYVEQFLTAMEIISQAQIDATSKDNTIEAIVSSIESDGSYKVTYQDESFTAYSDAKYEIGDIVFVLRPGSSTEIKDSVIVAKKQTASSLISEIVEEDISYIELSNNIINKKPDQSYSFDNALLKGLIQRVGAIKIGAKFKTELNKAFFTGDIDLLNYGVKIEAKFKTESGTEIRKWILDINDMIGVPYYYSDFTLQEKVISIEDPENFIEITSCEFFSNLEEEKGTILCSDISLFAIIERNKITNNELWLINCSNDNILENNADKIELQAVLVSKNEENIINSYEWYLQNGFGEWQKLENKTSGQLVITKSMLESGAGAIYCVGDIFKSEIIEIVNNPVVDVSIKESSFANKYIYYRLSATSNPQGEYNYKWYKVYTNLKTYISIGEGPLLEVNASSIDGEAIFLCKAYLGNTWVGESFLALKENATVYTISLSNDYETVAGNEDKVSTEVRVFLNGTLLNEDSKPSVAPDKYKDSLQWNSNNKCWDFTVETKNFTKAEFSFSGASAIFQVKKMPSNADYSLVLSQDIVNLSDNPTGEITVNVVKSENGSVEENPLEAKIYINNDNPLTGKVTIKYSTEDIEDGKKVQAGDQISVVLKVKIANTEFVWDSEKIQFVKNGVSFTGITEYYYATANNSKPTSKPQLNNGVVDANGWAITSAAAGFSSDKPYLWNIEYISKDDGSGLFSDIEQASVWGQDGRGEEVRVSYYAVNNSESSAPAGDFKEVNGEISVPSGWRDNWPSNSQQGNAIWEVECVKYSKVNSSGQLWKIGAKELVTYIPLDGMNETGVSLTTSGLVFTETRSSNGNIEIVPSQISIERNLFGDIPSGTSWVWEYSYDQESWTPIDTDNTKNIYTSNDYDDVIVKNGALSGNNDIYIRIFNGNSYDNASYKDGCNLIKVPMGANGEDAIVWVWDNPVLVFSAQEGGVVPEGQSETATLTVLKGGEKQTVTLSIEDQSSLPTTGITVTPDSNQVKVSVGNGGSNFGNSGNTNGILKCKFTLDGNTYNPTLSWIKTVKGDKGSSAQDFNVISSAPAFIKNKDGEINNPIILTAKATNIELAGATIRWQKKNGNEYINTGNTGETYTLNANTNNIGNYRAYIDANNNSTYDNGEWYAIINIGLLEDGEKGDSGDSIVDEIITAYWTQKDTNTPIPPAKLPSKPGNTETPTLDNDWSLNLGSLPTGNLHTYKTTNVRKKTTRGTDKSVTYTWSDWSAPELYAIGNTTDAGLIAQVNTFMGITNNGQDQGIYYVREIKDEQGNITGRDEITNLSNFNPSLDKVYINAEYIKANSIEADKIVSHSIGAEQIATKSITASEINADDLTVYKLLVTNGDDTLIDAGASNANGVTIGGFTVTKASMQSETDEAKVYLGTDKIQLGEKFTVTNKGVVEAKEGSFTGTITATGGSFTGTVNVGSDTENNDGVGLIGNSDGLVAESLMNPPVRRPIRIYAGAKTANNVYPFMVLSDGSVYATAAKLDGEHVILSDTIIFGSSGTIGSFTGEVNNTKAALTKAQQDLLQAQNEITNLKTQNEKLQNQLEFLNNKLQTGDGTAMAAFVDNEEYVHLNPGYGVGQSGHGVQVELDLNYLKTGAIVGDNWNRRYFTVYENVGSTSRQRPMSLDSPILFEVGDFEDAGFPNNWIYSFGFVDIEIDSRSKALNTNFSITGGGEFGRPLQIVEKEDAFGIYYTHHFHSRLVETAPIGRFELVFRTDPQIIGIRFWLIDDQP